MDVKTKIYSDLSSILTMYEQNLADDQDLYNVLCEIQNNWELITAQE